SFVDSVFCCSCCCSCCFDQIVFSSLIKIVCSVNFARLFVKSLINGSLSSSLTISQTRHFHCFNCISTLSLFSSYIIVCCSFVDSVFCCSCCCSCCFDQIVFSSLIKIVCSINFARLFVKSLINGSLSSSLTISQTRHFHCFNCISTLSLFSSYIIVCCSFVDSVFCCSCCCSCCFDQIVFSSLIKIVCSINFARLFVRSFVSSVGNDNLSIS